jgi:hypothetical protein
MYLIKEQLPSADSTLNLKALMNASIAEFCQFCHVSPDGYLRMLMSEKKVYEGSFVRACVAESAVDGPFWHLQK